jgi:hypothetical protein
MARKGELTDYGFTFGALEVVRLMHLEDGRVCVQIKTEHDSIDVYASPQGRSLRAFRKGKGEMKP